MIIKVGFFFELDPELFVSTVESMRRSEPCPDERRILEYLESGAICGILTMLDEDLLEDPPVPVGVPEIRTDGKYLWPSTLCYYVKRYHVTLPGAFVQDMRHNSWKVPSGIDTDAIAQEGETRIG